MSNWSSVLRAFLLGIFAIGSRPEIIKSALPVLSYTYTNAIMRYMSNMSKNYFSPILLEPLLMQDCSCTDYTLYKVRTYRCIIKGNWIKTILKYRGLDRIRTRILILRRDALCPLSYQSVQTEFSLSLSVSHRYGRNKQSSKFQFIML